jgi:hypothetical protein
MTGNLILDSRTFQQQLGSLANTLAYKEEPKLWARAFVCRTRRNSRNGTL